MRQAIILPIAIFLFFTACGEPADSGGELAPALRTYAQWLDDQVATFAPDPQLTAALDQAAPDQIVSIIEEYLCPNFSEATKRLQKIIRDPGISAARKHELLRPILAEVGPVLKTRAEAALAATRGRDLGEAGPEIRSLLMLAHTLSRGAMRVAKLPAWQHLDGPLTHYEKPFAPAMSEGMLDKFWLMYHWTEVLGGLYDDSDYTWVFAETERTSYLDQEIGTTDIEMFPDYWRVATDVWNDPALSDNQRLMAAKFTMWQNEDWGGGNHYINEWWSWEPAHQDEDNALFLGNQMAALAALYELTRDERTLHRLGAMLDAFRHYDTLTVDDPDPIAQEPPDGRITRGTITRNLYLEDEMQIFDIEFSGGQFIFHHNNSWPDHYTGRERKNVSRDQYYGLFLGYRTLWEVLTAIEDRTAAEQDLLDSLVEHATLVTDYVFGQSNLHWQWGLDYMLYALFEGSCANPPNFTFMMFFGHVGLEEITGQSFTQFDWLHDLGHDLFAFGRSLGLIWISEALFEPAHTGLTALNQYLSGFYMSDITAADWMFLWPPELLVKVNAGRRRLWRRVVAAFYRKYGYLGHEQYRRLADETFDADLHLRPTIDIIYNSTQGDYVKLEPTYVGLENFMLPWTFFAGRAANREEIAAALLARYDELVADGSVNFADTDLPY